MWASLVDAGAAPVTVSVTGVLLGYLWWINSKEHLHNQRGWHFVVAGTALLFLAGLVDTLDSYLNFGQSADGDVSGYANIVEMVGYIGGANLFLIGFLHWLPVVRSLKRVEHDLRIQNDQLEELVEERTTALRSTNTQLRRGIDERRSSEESMRQSELRFRRVFEFTPVGIAIVDASTAILRSNRALQEMLGYTEDELGGMSIREMSHPDDWTESFKLSKKVGDGARDGYSLEMRYYKKNGNTASGHMTVSPLPDAGGSPRSIALIEDITERQQREHELAKQADELRQSRERIIVVQESVRRAIAQQLHGSVQNRLIILQLRLRDLEKEAVSKELAAGLQEIRESLTEVLDKNIRTISHQLYPSILRRGLVPALRSLGDQFEPVLNVEMKLDTSLVREETANRDLVPEEVRLAAYRIAEEAITNVVKHAKASKATIELELPEEGCLRLRATDNGQGFDPDAVPDGLGTLSMKDYAQAAGGLCVTNASVGGGTEITATLPLAGPGATRQQKSPP